MGWLKRLWHKLCPPAPQRLEPTPWRTLIPPRKADTSDLQKAFDKYYQDKYLSDSDLLSEDEKALFEQLAPEAPEKVIAYPPKVDEQEARDWVSAELERRTGGLTRHPLDVTSYPEPPNEADLAAAEKYRPGAAAMFAHGYSMRYLHALLGRAKRKDHTLTDEQLMALRSRGLI